MTFQTLCRTVCFCAASALLASAPAQAQSGAPVPVPVPNAACASATSQKQLNECAYDAFLAATADYSAAYKALTEKLDKDNVRHLQRVQKAWMAYRTATCDFEAAGVKGGSAADMVQWQCAARYTRVRTVELKKMAACPEGDLACPPLRR